MIDEISRFTEAMTAHGLDPGQIVTNGIVHRFPTWGDRSGEASGAYWHNGRVGWFQDWRTMDKPEIIKGHLSEADQAALDGSFNGSGQKVSREALEAGIRKIWNAGTDPEGHPYLVKKQISVVPEVKQFEGKIIIPVFSIDGKLNGLQRIDAAGNKRFLAGTRKKGSFFSISGSETSENLVICEGFATGVSIHMATNCGVAVAFDAGNLLPVAKEICKKIEPQNVIIAGDNDSWKIAEGQKDTGSMRATEAAKKTGANLVLPQFKNPDVKDTTDFNDLFILEGPKAVEYQINSARTSKDEKADEPECYLEPLTDFDADSSDCYQWLIEKLVPLGEPMIIGGKGSSGKTTLALEFTIQILKNDPAAAVVYICAEGTYRDTKIRARQMALTKFNRFFFLKRKGGTTSFKLSDKTDLDLVKKTLQRPLVDGTKIALVVIDSIRGMQRGSLSDDLVGEVMQTVNDLVCNSIGATVCYIHHSKKNIQDIAAMDALLGSVTIVNSVRHALFVKKLSNRVREVEVCKSNLGYEDTVFSVEMDATNRIIIHDLGIEGSTADEINRGQIDRAEEIILSMIGSGEEVPAYQIYERGELESISVETMKRAKKLHRIDVRKRGKIWVWRYKEEGQGGDIVDTLDTLQANILKSIEKEEGQEGGQGCLL